MTGFADGEAANDVISINIEIKGYNSRFLEIYINAPPALSFLETSIRNKTASFCTRGKIELFIRVKENMQTAEVTVNKALLQKYISAAKEIRPCEDLPLSVLFTLEGVIATENAALPQEALAALMDTLLDKTLTRFDAERRREGKAACDVILEYIQIIDTKTNAISERTADIEAHIKTNIHTRFYELLGEQADEQRILAETAVLLMKWTIAEEVTRLQGHLAAFMDEIRKNEAPSKKLEFLCQEINREINTISSKSPFLDVSRAVVDCKEALENIREQLRNVE
jgi:uncharacterized protein (TIGR00255 family)